MPYEPAFDPNNNSENECKLVERFAKAGWLTNNKPAQLNLWNLSYSTQGLEQIKTIVSLWRKAVPDFFATRGDPKELAKLAIRPVSERPELIPVFEELAKVARRLQPPAFTVGETDTLNGWFVYLAMRGIPEAGSDWHPL